MVYINVVLFISIYGLNNFKQKQIFVFLQSPFDFVSAKVVFMIYSLKLKLRHAVNNCALAAGFISTGRETLFGSQLSQTRASNTMTPIASRPARLSPNQLVHRALEKKSKSEWQSQWGGKGLNISYLIEERNVYLTFAIVYT